MQYDEDVEFQRSLLAAAWTDEKFIKAGAELIRPEFFTEEVLGGLATVLLRFVRDHGKAPDLGAALAEVKREVAPGRKYGDYETEIRLVWARRGGNVDFYKKQAVHFARTQAVISAVEEAHRQVAVGDFDGVLNLVTKAVRTGEHAFNGKYDFFKGTKQRVLDYLGKGDGEAVHRVSTGLPPIDKAMRGRGLGPGEMGVVEALPKHGKSTMLVHLGAAALEAGETVLHVSVENSKELVAERYDVRLWGRPRAEIEKAPRDFYNFMKDLSAKMKSKLLISAYPTKTLTASALAASIQNAEPHPTLVILDYADEMKGHRKRDERYEEVGELYEQLRRVAGECAVPIWTASQANRIGFNEKVIDMRHFAGAVSKAGTMDVGFSINFDDVERHRGDARLYVMGSRLGPSGYEVDVTIDWETCVVRCSTGGDE